MDADIEAAVPGAQRTALGAQRNWALFLDVDGTLLDIAPSPDEVVVPDGLPATLEAVSTWLGGALAVVSGRPLKALDRLFSPLILPCAAEHGAVLRGPDGTLHQADAVKRIPPAWLARLHQAAQDWPGVLIDEKCYAIAVHYRQAPEREEDVYRLVHRIVAGNPDFEALPARMAIELRHRGLHKGAAVHHFMTIVPFAGRIPVFVGDDVTDEDGFRAARAFGGLALHVNEAFAGKPANVRAWLKAFRGAA